MINRLYAVAALLLCVQSSGNLLAEEALPFEVLKPSLDVGVVVSDMEASKKFYGDVLGLKLFPGELPMPDGGKMARLQAGATTVKLLHFPGEKPKHQGGIQAAVGIRLLTLLLPDLDAIIANAEAAGMKKPGALGKPGSRLMFINDPDGNQVEILESTDRTDQFMIGLTVSDTEASRKFYGEVLGIEELDSGPLFGTGGPMKYNFRSGPTTIKFWSFDKEMPVHTGEFTGAIGIRYFTFMVKDVDAAAETLKARGANVVFGPEQIGGLARVMFVADPDGNWIEFAQIGGPRKN